MLAFWETSWSIRTHSGRIDRIVRTKLRLGGPETRNPRDVIRAGSRIGRMWRHGAAGDRYPSYRMASPRNALSAHCWPYTCQFSPDLCHNCQSTLDDLPSSPVEQVLRLYTLTFHPIILPDLKSVVQKLCSPSTVDPASRSCWERDFLGSSDPSDFHVGQPRLWNRSYEGPTFTATRSFISEPAQFSAPEDWPFRDLHFVLHLGASPRRSLSRWLEYSAKSCRKVWSFENPFKRRPHRARGQMTLRKLRGLSVSATVFIAEAQHRDLLLVDLTRADCPSFRSPRSLRRKPFTDNDFFQFAEARHV